MSIEITGCINCPMFSSYLDDRNGWESNCGHPSFESIGVLEEIDIDNNANPITPEKCPLNTEPITISKTK